MRLLLLLSFVIFSACGSDVAPTEELEVREENAPDNNTCRGCVDAVGQCLDGDDNNSCGTSGTMCIQCDDGESCNNGTCEASDDCDATCDGCCDENGTCQSGNSDNSCGQNGESCFACADAACVNGTCENAACGPENCDGCCDANGVCQTGDLDMSCGLGGIACNDCASIQNICLQGICTGAENSCAQNCNGCCDGQTCIENTTEAQCGAAGNMCVACNAGDTCVAGSCTTVGMSDRFDVHIVSSVAADTKPNGDSWDAFDIFPNSFVVAVAQDAQDNVFGDNTGVVEDFQVNWDETLLLDAPLDALNNAFQIQLWDQDTLSEDDVVCIFNLVVDASVLSGTDQTSICPEDADTQVVWRLVPR